MDTNTTKLAEGGRRSFELRSWRDAHAQLSAADHESPLGPDDLECLAPGHGYRQPERSDRRLRRRVELPTTPEGEKYAVHSMPWLPATTYGLVMSPPQPAVA